MITGDVVQFNEKHKWCGCLGIVTEKKEYINDIRYMVGVPMPFTVNMFYYCDPDGHSEAVQDQNKRPVDELTPCIRSISAEHIDCEGVNASLICAYGLPEMPIEELRFENISASFLPEDRKGYVYIYLKDAML